MRIKISDIIVPVGLPAVKNATVVNLAGAIKTIGLIQPIADVRSAGYRTRTLPIAALLPEYRLNDYVVQWRRTLTIGSIRARLWDIEHTW